MIKKLVILAAILFVADKLYQNAKGKSSDSKTIANPGGRVIALEATPDLANEIKKYGDKKIEIFL